MLDPRAVDAHFVTPNYFRTLGVTLFAGEAEGTLDGLLADGFRSAMKPVYNYLLDLPGLQGQVTPFLPSDVAKRSFDFTAFDVGRGCPFRCSFCTIINVQGRKSRYRDPDRTPAPPSRQDA